MSEMASYVKGQRVIGIDLPCRWRSVYRLEGFDDFDGAQVTLHCTDGPIARYPSRALCGHILTLGSSLVGEPRPEVKCVVCVDELRRLIHERKPKGWRRMLRRAR